jgi:membrane protease YdiL (CAAX protease family)
MPTFADHAFTFLLVVALPAYAAVSYRRLVRQLATGRTNARLQEYRLTLVVQWSLTVVALLVWLAADRPLSLLGVAVPLDLRSLAGAAVTAACLAFLALQWRATMHMTPDVEASLRGQVASVADLLPRTPDEAAAFRALAVTAGICEEVLYRGFLIWYFGSYVGGWPAAVAAGVAFGIAHFYQGLGGVAKTGTVGLITGLLYVATASLLWPMIIHAAVDLHGGAVARRVLTLKHPTG